VVGYYLTAVTALDDGIFLWQGVMKAAEVRGKVPDKKALIKWQVEGPA
jgi:hypothetical protein